MKYKLLVLTLFLIGFASAQLGYDNPKLPRIENPAVTTVTSTVNVSGNVSSVTAGNNCLIINPTTGAVIASFNTSCDTNITYYGDGFSILLNNSNSFSFNYSTLDTVYFNATQSQLVEGTIDGGNLGDTQHPDAKYDKRTFNFSEVATSPALDLRVNFTNVNETFTTGIIRYKTTTLVGDYPLIQVWNYDDSEWENYPALAESLTFVVIEESVFDPASHIENGVVQMRLYKASNGNINNQYFVDWFAIAKGFGVPAGQEVDPLSFHKNESINNAGFNITSNWFFGLFNWIIGTNPSQKYLTFNGSTLDFSESNLNGTIDHRVTLNNTNTFNSTYNNILNQTCPSGQVVNGTLSNGTIKCQTVTATPTNPFNQDLNTTNNVQFNNITAQNISYSQWLFGKDILLSNIGGAFFPGTTFQVTTIDVGAGLVSIPLIKFTGGAGLTVGAISDGLYIIPALASTSPRILLSRNTDATDVWVFQNQNTSGILQIFRQNPFGAGILSGEVHANASFFISGNVTETNPIYRVNVSLDTDYNNNYNEEILIIVPLTWSASGASGADATFLINNKSCGTYGMSTVSISSTTQTGQVSCVIDRGDVYRVNTTISGGGSIAMNGNATITLI